MHSLNEDDIFKTLHICYIDKGKKRGIVCIGVYNMKHYKLLTPYADNVHLLLKTAYVHKIPLISYDYFGLINSFYVNKTILSINDKLYKTISSKRTLHKEESIEPLIHFKYANAYTDGIELPNNLIYKEPYIKNKLTGLPICLFKPIHQSTVTKDMFKIQDSCLVYDYVDSVYILTENSRRHISSELKDRFILNLETQRITRECNFINNDGKLIQGRYEYKNGLWTTLQVTSKVIMGIKTVN